MRSFALQGRVTLILCLLAFSLVLVALGPQAIAQTLDTYGGMTALPSLGGATGYFRLEKNPHGRWMFVDPLGNYFWLIASYVENANYYQHTPVDIIATKYGGHTPLWAQYMNSRLLSWGFTSIGEYSSPYDLPVNTNGSHNNANPVKRPFMLGPFNALADELYRGTYLGLPESVKSIMSGVPSNVIVWRGSGVADMYDPKVPTGYLDELAIWRRQYTDGFDTPWIVGITPDDTDKLFGLKNGDNPNVGFLTAVTHFDYTGIGGPWIDPKLYSKYAWTCGIAGIDFGFGMGKGYLDNKYVTIAALNTAWGTSSFYTSFCDAGGYGVGTGVLDEDDRHAWIGHNPFPAHWTIPAAVAADMKQFVYQYSKKYATTAVAAIRTVDTHHVIFGPAAISALGHEDQPEVLRGFVDGGFSALQMGESPTADYSGFKATYDLTGLPIYIWYCIDANPDSPWHDYVSDQGCYHAATQALRGARYTSDLNSMIGQTGTNGDHYLLGFDWWENSDGNIREKTNWGFVTDRDNAYDGVHDVNHSVPDGSYMTVPENRNYGDFITPVTAANANILQQLINELH